MMHTMKFFLAGLVLVLLFPTTGLSGPPQDTLQNSVDQVIILLRDPAYKDATTRPEMRAKLIKTIQSIFDATELSRRALAANWNKFSEQQQKRFTDAFLTLLQNTYLDRIESYSDEKVHYVDERMLAADRAEVNTVVSGKGKEIPISYRMRNASGWKVYDVVIEGVSLVQNYRNQFAQILMNQPPDALIDMLVKKS
ncbi:MlaC/ttg2D family ABC transporter substrate-binding protein [Desulfolutivibrio sulfoxidireducens]|uniref:MlaC/ttg2D family ABC transporter substrate-binding protein n=1 Tax=Desulfolutivibrio sulfoxidireducens TaxID=2773299 RepID=UPI001FE53A35|nr:ABC transporter substrate-binding protein [Desulfolutivibrio sulfoxidireducens]